MKTCMLGKRLLLLVIITLFFLQPLAYGSRRVAIEYLFWDPSKDPRWCSECKSWVDAYEDFLAKNQTLVGIQNEYLDKVSISRTDYFSADGQAKHSLLNITKPNSIAVESSVTEDNNATYLRQLIDSYLNETPIPGPPSRLSFIPAIVLAFSFGFFETFSPCLLALLSFVLSYSIGEASSFKEGFLRVTVFGAGFLLAALLLGLATAAAFSSMYSLNSILMLITCVFAMIFGLNLLGLHLPNRIHLGFNTKPLITKLSRKHALRYSGLFTLGFLFYFLDPCIAPLFFSMLPLLLIENVHFVVFSFALGVFIPFVFIGLIAGSVSRMARTTYKHKSKVRAISGFILIGFAIYLLGSFLL